MPRLPPLTHTARELPKADNMTKWLQLIRGEFSEMPGLHLTKKQVQRLWNLDASTCEAILEALESAQFLRRTPSGNYVKRAS